MPRPLMEHPNQLCWDLSVASCRLRPPRLYCAGDNQGRHIQLWRPALGNHHPRTPSAAWQPAGNNVSKAASHPLYLSAHCRKASISCIWQACRMTRTLTMIISAIFLRFRVRNRSSDRLAMCLRQKCCAYTLTRGWLLCRVPDEAPQDIVDLMERCMQMDSELRPDAAECIEVVSKHLRLPQNGPKKFRDAPMRGSSGESPLAYRRSSDASTVETRNSAPRSNASEPKPRGPPSGSSDTKPPLWHLT